MNYGDFGVMAGAVLSACRAGEITIAVTVHLIDNIA
jgi:hypothetical protein